MASRRLTQQHSRAPTALPPYEPPFIPLSASQLQTLQTLSEGAGRTTALEKLAKTLSEAVVTLGHAAGDLGELVPVGEDERDEEHEERQAVLDELEVMARSLVDANKRAVDMGAVLKGVVSSAREHGKEVRRRQRDEEEDEHDATRIAEEREGVWGKYEDGVAAKGRDYEKLGMRARLVFFSFLGLWECVLIGCRYAEIAEYVQFRKMVWNAQNGEAQMPKPSTWFLHLEGGRRKSQAAEDPDSDSDLEIAQERQSYSCPLTLCTFVEPFTSTVCPHSFERTAIEDYIKKASGNVSCPVPGCSKMLTLDTVRRDQVLERNVKKAAQRAARRREEDDGEEDDDDSMADADESPQKKVKVKNERGKKRTGGRARVMDIDSDEDDD